MQTHMKSCRGICGASSINHFSYSKLVRIKTIETRFDDDTIDTVYVRSVGEDEDRMFDCHEPVDMINSERIMREQSPSVVRWRLHHHHRIVDQEKIDGKERECLQAGWRREYLNDIYYKMIMETPHGDSFLTKR